MILKNPTNNDLAIKFLGVEYTLKANQSKEIPDECAQYWRTKLHKFLEVGGVATVESVAAVAPKEEVKVEVKEEKKEEVKIEVKDVPLAKADIKMDVKSK